MRICSWCGVRLSRWRSITFRRYCAKCHTRTQDAGIYLKAGGPDWPYMSRVPEAET